MSHALEFAHDVHLRASRVGVTVDHLTLQKLTFYAYGAALAHGHRSEVGSIPFAPWKHGPVLVELWQEHKGSGSAALPLPTAAPRPSYSQALNSVLDDIIEVYGRLDAWALRCESHLEAPWISARNAGAEVIDDAALQEHFERKFAPHSVRLPTHLGSHSSDVLDGIPQPRFASLQALAEALRSRS